MDEIEKLERLRRQIAIKFTPPLLYSAEGCTNEASVGTVDYNVAERSWMLVPLCQSHVDALAKTYGIGPNEESNGN